MSRRLRLFPLNAVLFPGAALNLHVFEPRYKQMIAACLDAGEPFGVVLIREGQETGDPTVEPHQIGTVAEIVESKPLPFGRYYLSTLGRERFRILQIESRDPFLTVDAEILDEPGGNHAHISSLHDRVRAAFLEYVELLSAFTGESSGLDLPQDAGAVSYAIADALQVTDSAKQRLLESSSTEERLTTELDYLHRLIPQLQKLLEQREAEMRVRRERGGEDEQRSEQERYFGKYFSAN